MITYIITQQIMKKKQKKKKLEIHWEIVNHKNAL